jgi:hypothetical protein
MLWVCVLSTFMEMLIYTIICVLYYTNEWSLSTNFQNAIMRSIENVIAYKKNKITINFGFEKIGILHPPRESNILFQSSYNLIAQTI